MMKSVQCHYGLLTLILWLSINSAHADLICSASMSTNTINIGNTITPDTANNTKITGTLNYSCTNNTESDRYVSACLGADGGDYNSSALDPRYMTASNGSKLAFTMTLPDGKLWGNNSSSFYQPNLFLIPRNKTISGNVVINVSLLPNFGNTLATQGVYSSDFSGNHTTLTYQSHINQITSDCKTGAYKQANFPFKIQATVINECKINTTSDIILGSRPTGTTSFIGSNNQAIDMTCTNGALYKIGLSPSNNNEDGAGVMISRDNETYRLPYQLSSNISGTVWGNNGNTYDTLTNGVTGQGNGTAQLHTVHVVVPNSDVEPAKYMDTVTIYVNY
ncbi:MAG: Csu type fimbrial protein [Psychrobacter sp.]